MYQTCTMYMHPCRHSKIKCNEYVKAAILMWNIAVTLLPAAKEAMYGYVWLPCHEFLMLEMSGSRSLAALYIGHRYKDTILHRAHPSACLALQHSACEHPCKDTTGTERTHTSAWLCRNFCAARVRDIRTLVHGHGPPPCAPK